MTEKKTEGVYQKILNIMSSVEYMPKDGKVEFGKTSYRYLSAERIVENVRKEMIKQKLIMYPAKADVTNQVPNEKDIIMTYRIVDTEDGSSIEVQVPGGGYDNADKKTYKALTGAYKYALRQTYAIETGDDDPDKTGSDELKGKTEKAEKKKLEPAGNGALVIDKKTYSTADIKNLFVDFHNGDTKEAKEDYELWEKFEPEQKINVLKDMIGLTAVKK
jgi:hypothetical protein